MISAGCDDDMVSTEHELAVAACEDLEAAHMAMVERCAGRSPTYVDCATVTGVKDMQALYETCIPALETGCYVGDTPPELLCHQLEFGRAESR